MLKKWLLFVFSCCLVCLWAFELQNGNRSIGLWLGVATSLLLLCISIFLIRKASKNLLYVKAICKID